jgi:hypothetical protein
MLVFWGDGGFSVCDVELDGLFSIPGSGFFLITASDSKGRGPNGRLVDDEIDDSESVVSPPTGFLFGSTEAGPVPVDGGPVCRLTSSDDLADSGSGLRGSGFCRGDCVSLAVAKSSSSSNLASASVLRCR